MGTLLDSMVSIQGGTIFVRDESNQTDWQVTLKPFQICSVPVTNEVWSYFSGDPLAGSIAEPVVDISWASAVRFCNTLSKAAGYEEVYVLEAEFEARFDSNANGFRLPTEAEWEYACRAGSNDVRYGELNAIAWTSENSGGVIHPVGLKEPNAWGLHDTLGNVWEWCWDLYDGTKYGRYRVFRGGGWSDPPRGCRASCRRKSHPSFHIDDLGFRLARNSA